METEVLFVLAQDVVADLSAEDTHSVYAQCIACWNILSKTKIFYEYKQKMR